MSLWGIFSRCKITLIGGEDLHNHGSIELASKMELIVTLGISQN